MGTWGNLGKVNCGKTDVILALCPGVMELFPTTGSKTDAMEMSTEGTRYYSVCSQLYFTFNNVDPT